MFNLDRDGYALAELVFTDTVCEELAAAMPEVKRGRGGVRHLLEHEAVARILSSKRFASIITSVVAPPAVAVNATLFDKTPESNWRVVWHQDRMIRTSEGHRIDAPWEALEGMVAARIHLDDATHDNGPLRVIPGSHRLRKLNDEEILKLASTQPQVELSTPRGSILLMRPLLVHASSPARSPAHRRVLHLEFATLDAIKPLDWDCAYPLA